MSVLTGTGTRRWPRAWTASQPCCRCCCRCETSFDSPLPGLVVILSRAALRAVFSLEWVRALGYTMLSVLFWGNGAALPPFPLSVAAVIVVVAVTSPLPTQTFPACCCRCRQARGNYDEAETLFTRALEVDEVGRMAHAVMWCAALCPAVILCIAVSDAYEYGISAATVRAGFAHLHSCLLRFTMFLWVGWGVSWSLSFGEALLRRAQGAATTAGSAWILMLSGVASVRKPSRVL